MRRPCTNETHAFVRRNPQFVDNLRHWPEMGAWIGECCACKSTVAIAYDLVPPPADVLADLVLG